MPELRVRREYLAACELVEGESPEAQLAEGEAQLRVERFALSTRELAQRYAKAWAGFAPVVKRMMQIERITRGDRLVAVYRELVDGRVDPAVGYVVAL